MMAKIASALAGIALALQSTAAAAQQQCLTEEEVGAIAIYSVPGVLQGIRLRCAGELSPQGYLARQGDTLAARYAALQEGVWPRARSGLAKVLAARGGNDAATAGMIARLPDQAVRPLLDALIVQETSPRVAPGDCWKVERVIEAVAPVDPRIAGTLLGTVAGVVQTDRFPVCRPGRR